MRERSFGWRSRRWSYTPLNDQLRMSWLDHAQPVPRRNRPTLRRRHPLPMPCPAPGRSSVPIPPSSQTVSAVPSKLIRAVCTVPSFRLMPRRFRSVCAKYSAFERTPTESPLTSHRVKSLLSGDFQKVLKKTLTVPSAGEPSTCATRVRRSILLDREDDAVASDRGACSGTDVTIPELEFGSQSRQRTVVWRSPTLCPPILRLPVSAAMLHQPQRRRPPGLSLWWS